MNLVAVLRAAAMCLTAGTLLCGCGLGQSQSALLVDADSTSGTTQSLSPFAVSGPWQLKYTFDCTKANSEGVLDADELTVDVFNGDDNSLAFEHPQTTLVSVQRRGALSFKTPGNYYVHVDTKCDWTMQVLDLGAGAAPSASPVPHVAQPHGTVPLDVTFASDFGPYNCDLTGTAASTCVVGDGTAAQSPFGALSMHLTVGLQRGTGDCSAAATMGTLTAANGDELNVKADKGEACTRSPVNKYSVAFTGGTGIFRNATGSATITDRQGTSDRWSGSITFSQ